MKRIALAILIAAVFVASGCEKPQEIEITSDPSRAALSIDQEFIGKTPLVYTIPDIRAVDKLRVIAEKRGFESELMTIDKKPDTDRFPSRVHLLLDPAHTAEEIKEETPFDY